MIRNGIILSRAASFLAVFCATCTWAALAMPISAFGADQADPSDPVTQVNGRPVWTDIRTGFHNAQVTHKFLIADVYTDWCGWCKKLDRDTFHNPAVEQILAESFVCAKVNAEDRGVGTSLARKYQVRGYPTILFFTPDGKLCNEIDRYVPPADMIETLKTVVSSAPQ
jgi:thioredoxin-related protein